MWFTFFTNSEDTSPATEQWHGGAVILDSQNDVLFGLRINNKGALNDTIIADTPLSNN